MAAAAMGLSLGSLKVLHQNILDKAPGAFDEALAHQEELAAILTTPPTPENHITRAYAYGVFVYCLSSSIPSTKKHKTLELSPEDLASLQTTLNQGYLSLDGALTDETKPVVMSALKAFSSVCPSSWTACKGLTTVVRKYLKPSSDDSTMPILAVSRHSRGEPTHLTGLGEDSDVTDHAAPEA